MKREKLEQYLGKTVTVTLFDGSTYTGKLRQTGTADLRTKNYTLFLTKGRYFVENGCYVSTLFRCSHVTKLKECEG